LGALRLADVGLDGVGQDKTTSILKCVEYSHSNLSESAQQLLLCLAPFSSFIYRDGIPLYAEELKKLEPFKDYDFMGFDDAIQEAINWGLLSPIDDSNDKLLSIQPVFPYFLQARLNKSTDKIQEALQNGFKNHYRGLASSYEDLMKSNDPHERQLGILFCRLEYENLYASLRLCMERKESISIYLCLDKYFRAINDVENQLKLAEEVNKILEEYPLELIHGELEHETLLSLEYLATSYLKTKKYAKSKLIYEKELLLLNSAKSVQVTQNRELFKATIYNQLGRVAQELRDWETARANYSQSLTIKIELNDRYSQASTYHNLGTIAQEMQELDEAVTYYHQALSLYVEFSDLYEQASTYQQLGALAQKQRKFSEAYANYIQSLTIKQEFGDRYSQAGSFHQLGIIAQEMQKLDEAVIYYQQALSIYVEFGDRYLQASVYNQLGRVAKDLNQWQEAYNYYSQALSIYIEFDDKVLQGKVYHNLGTIKQELNEWDSARHYYYIALKISKDFSDLSSSSMTCQNLGKISQELREWDDALHYYHNALHIAENLEDQSSQALIYYQLTILFNSINQKSDAQESFLQSLQIWKSLGDINSIIKFSIPILNPIYRPERDNEFAIKISKILGLKAEEINYLTFPSENAQIVMNKIWENHKNSLNPDINPALDTS
jgi:tetratricopeptide (TPR) repeat protein